MGLPLRNNGRFRRGDGAAADWLFRLPAGPPLVLPVDWRLDLPAAKGTHQRLFPGDLN
jgi:hypothetical protein